VSEIKVDKIQGTSGSSTAITLSGANSTVNGTLAVTGVHTVGNNAIHTSDGGAVTQNLVQGLAKHWGNLDGTGTISIRDSFNTSSATDIATGTYRFDYTNNMANINYSLQESVSETTGTEGNLNRYGAIDHVDTSFCRFGATFNSNYLDVDELYTAAFGDLA
tara:strand:+ start:52 stop:537 length:486 start_codon:yes stop_codon:yes gene_type:complete